MESKTILIIGLIFFLLSYLFVGFACLMEDKPTQITEPSLPREKTLIKTTDETLGFTTQTAGEYEIKYKQKIKTEIYEYKQLYAEKEYYKNGKLIRVDIE